MFKPQKQTRRLFEVFLATLGYDTAPRRYLCGLAAALWQYRGLVFVATLVTVALVLGPLVLTALGLATPDIPSAALRWVAMGSWIVALLMALTLSTVLALLAGLVWDVWFGLVPNGFGLCRGWSEEEAARVQQRIETTAAKSAEVDAARWSRLRAFLRPNGRPQERELSVLAPLLKLGLDWPALLADVLDPGHPGNHLLFWEEGGAW